MKSDLNKDNYKADFHRHEHIKHNLARIKKKRLPNYGGRQGYLPPLEGEEEPIRQGSAPTDGNNPRGGLRDSQNQGDYYTVVHAASNSGSQKDGKSQSTRAQAVPLDAAGQQPHVETVAEHPNEYA